MNSMRMCYEAYIDHLPTKAQIPIEQIPIEAPQTIDPCVPIEAPVPTGWSRLGLRGGPAQEK